MLFRSFFHEDIHLFLYFLITVGIFFIFFSYDNTFSYSFLSLVSSISNIGISLNVEQTNIQFLYLLLVIIGGSFISTSSGLRFLKIYSLTKYSLNQILSYQYKIGAKYLVLTNGNETYCIGIDLSSKKVKYLEDIPQYINN